MFRCVCVGMFKHKKRIFNLICILFAQADEEEKRNGNQTIQETPNIMYSQSWHEMYKKGEAL